MVLIKKSKEREEPIGGCMSGTFTIQNTKYEAGAGSEGKIGDGSEGRIYRASDETD